MSRLPALAGRFVTTGTTWLSIINNTIFVPCHMQTCACRPIVFFLSKVNLWHFVICENANNICLLSCNRTLLCHLSEAQRCYCITSQLWQASSQTWDDLSAKLPPRIRFIGGQRRSEVYHLWKMECQSSDSYL